MKKVYDTYFHVSKNEKICDKVMFSRVMASAIFIVSCLFIMALTAYAYFTCNVSSSYNIIKSAYFQTTVNIVDNSQNPVNITGSDTQIKKATLLAGIDYSITIGIDSDNSNAKMGFCIISGADCNEQYHTVQLSKDNAVGVNEINFTLRVTEQTEIVFTDSWGTSSCFGDNSKNEVIIDNGEIITVSVINMSYTNNNINETAETTGLDLTMQTTVPQQTGPIQKPETTTGTPETTTVTPETTTVTPETTTGAPETTTGAPETTTGAPETTTGTPETTTGAPETTTGAPETTADTPETTAGTPDITETAPKE